jgi:hypothetical protein
VGLLRGVCDEHQFFIGLVRQVGPGWSQLEDPPGLRMRDLRRDYRIRLRVKSSRALVGIRGRAKTHSRMAF